MKNQGNCNVSYIVAVAASEPEASGQGSNPNLYMWVKISILPLARCIMVPVGFYHNAARSVAVWSFFHCFDSHEDRASFQAEQFRRFSGEFFMIMLTFQQYLHMLSTYYIVWFMFMFMYVNDYTLYRYD